VRCDKCGRQGRRLGAVVAGASSACHMVRRRVRFAGAPAVRALGSYGGRGDELTKGEVNIGSEVIEASACE
jgi:hypothetical protein